MNISDKLDGKNSFRYLNFLGMLYVTIFICSVVMAHKIILFGNNTVTSVSSFIVPVTYVLLDAITEVYGYHAARKLIWSTLVCELIFALICSGLLLLPSPPFLDNNVAYQEVVGSLLRIFIGSFMGVLIGSFINIYFMSKLKIVYKGRYFMLRSILSSTFGELIFTVVCIGIVFVGSMPAERVFELMYTSYFVKLIFSTIGVVPVSILVIYLKRHEGIDSYDYQINFNPFKIVDTPN